MPDGVSMPFPLPILAQAEAAGGLGMFLPLIAMVVIFYFLLWRPQQKEAQNLQKLVASLQKGDRVVTASGVHGKIHEARADTLVLEISPNAYLTVDRDAVKRKVDPKPETPAKPEAKGS